jgi:outer membrane protein assembly factor BamD
MKKLSTITQNLSRLLLLCCLLAGCANRIPDSSDADLYAKATYDLDKGYYTAAIQKLKGIDSRFPFGIFSIQAQLDLIYAYYASGSYQLCQAASTRFIRMHPNYHDVDYCYYMKGLSSYAIYAFGSKLPLNLATRAAGDARLAFQDLNDFITRYPNSKYAKDARQRMVSIKNTLAKHELMIGKFYFKKKAYVAAINRAETVINTFQNSNVTADALVLMAQSYQQLKLTEEVKIALSLLKANYPKHPALKDAKFKKYNHLI